MLPLADDTLPDRHADLRQRVRVDTTTLDWDASPSGTVWRKPLYRVGGEHGPVTSLVRYAPGGAFRPHAHPEGEELFVLEGTVRDEEGVAGPGYWLRYPPGDAGAFRSDAGCRLYVRVGGLG
jgi:quercetin dioxygenase-like cupin family protein